MSAINSSSYILKQHFLKKKKDSARFSLRYLAQKLSLSPSYLSQILNGKRTLPSGLVDPICELLDIDQDTKEILISKILKNQGWNRQPANSLRRSAERFSTREKDWEALPLQALNLLSDWKTLVILESTQLKDYDGTPEFLMQRLGFTKLQVQGSLALLKNFNLLQKNETGILVKSKKFLEFQSKLNKKLIVKYHQEILRRAQSVMEEQTSDLELQRRIISSAIFTCSKDQVPLLRSKIAEFMRTVAVEACETPEEEVYQFSVSFFPHTK